MVPASASPSQSRHISALQVIQHADGSQHSGLITQISAESTIRVRGDGFNERTVMVEAGGLLYYVFRSDLQGLVDMGGGISVPKSQQPDSLFSKRPACAGPDAYVVQGWPA